MGRRDLGNVTTTTEDIDATSVAAAGGILEGDARLSDARAPTAHAPDHTDGTDDIQSATAAQKGLATATQITKLDGVEALADVTDAANVDAAGAVMDGDFSAAEGFMRKTGAGTYEAIKSNISAITDPSATDDSAAGYVVGSRWINVALDKEFVCLDATATAAVWTETTGGGGGGGESNTASNVGIAGVGVFKQKTGVDLEFKNINAAAGGKVTITDDVGNDEIDIQVVDATITQKGAVELATDGEAIADVVVQGNDTRLLFGTEYHYVEALAVSTTTAIDPAWTNKLTMTTASLPAGTYHIGVQIALALDKNLNAKAIDAQLEQDNGGTPGSGTQIWSTASKAKIGLTGDSNEPDVKCGFSKLVLTAGVHTFDINFRVSIVQAGTVESSQAKIALWRIV